MRDPSTEMPEKGYGIRIKTDNLKDFGHEDPLKPGPLQERLTVESVEELNPPAADGSRYQCTLLVPGNTTIVARENQIRIVRHWSS